MPFDFTGVKRAEEPFEWEGASYVVVSHPSEEVYAAWRDEQIRSSGIVERVLAEKEGQPSNGPAAKSSLAASAAVLVAGCVFRVERITETAEDAVKQGIAGRKLISPVSVEEVRRWPHAVVGPLFDWIMRESGLDKEARKGGVDFPPSASSAAKN